MEYIRFNKDVRITFKPVEGARVGQAVAECILFVRKHGLSGCDLVFNGYLFDIEPDSDICQKLNDYYYWANEKACIEVNKVSPNKGFTKQKIFRS